MAASTPTAASASTTGTTWSPWTWCPPVLRKLGPGSQGWSTWWQGSVTRTASPNAKGPGTNILPVLPESVPSTAELWISSGFLTAFALLQVSTRLRASEQFPLYSLFPETEFLRRVVLGKIWRWVTAVDWKTQSYIPQSRSQCKTIHLIWWWNTEIHSEVFLLCCQIGTEHMWHVEHSKSRSCDCTNMRRVRY